MLPTKGVESPPLEISELVVFFVEVLARRI
jgi:hypothetical protein